VHAHLFTDNRGLAQALINPFATCGQQFLLELHNAHRYTMSDVHIHWLPAHIGDLEHDKADRLAKEAAGLDSRGKNAGQPPINTPLARATVTPLRMERTKASKAKRQSDWTNGTTGRQHYRIQKMVNKKKTLNIYSKTSSRAQDTIIA
jgi:hypothetical protein